MSEANTPPNNHNLPGDSTHSSAKDWFQGWDDFAEPTVASTESDRASDDPTPADSDQWQPVTFSNVLEVSAAPHPENSEPIPDAEQATNAEPEPAAEHWTDQAVPMASIDLPNWAANRDKAIAPPSPAELISLIQELNQCNNALLDRVAQLEDALDQATAPTPNASDGVKSLSTSQAEHDLAVAKSQITELFQQLEAAHQTSKRQQILVETLSVQLEAGQERISHLERDCALVQQRLTEQSQALAQSENARRDLISRLQRQQRYTLQFKAALEKCLDVSPNSLSALEDELETATPPWYENQDQSAIAALSPKSHHIKPWSSQPQMRMLSKIREIVSTTDASDWPQVEPIFGADCVDDSDTSDVVDATSTTVAQFPVRPTEPQPSVSYDLRQKSGAKHRALADVSDAVPAQVDDLTTQLPSLPPEVIQAGISELQVVLGEILNTDLATLDGNEAEQVRLWQDLAKLVDVSSDDLGIMARASAIDTEESSNPFDTAAIEATESDAASESSDTTSGSTDDVAQPITQAPSSSASLSFNLVTTTANASTPTSEHEQGEEQSSPFNVNPSWPSPLVHPLRQTKKISSLAAVNLPKFS